VGSNTNVGGSSSNNAVGSSTSNAVANSAGMANMGISIIAILLTIFMLIGVLAKRKV